MKYDKSELDSSVKNKKFNTSDQRDRLNKSVDIRTKILHKHKDVSPKFKKVNVIKDIQISKYSNRSESVNPNRTGYGSLQNKINVNVNDDCLLNVSHNEMLLSQFQNVDKIINEYNYVYQLRHKIDNKQNINKSSLNSTFQSSADDKYQDSMNRTMSQLKHSNFKKDFTPNINENSKNLVKKLNYAEKGDIIDRLQQNNFKQEDITNKNVYLNGEFTLKPRINQNSKTLLQTSSKFLSNEDPFQKNYEEYQKRLERLNDNIKKLENEFPFKPTKSINKFDEPFDLEYFIQRNQTRQKKKQRKQCTIGESYVEFNDCKNFPDINPGSVRILIENGQIDADKFSDYNLLKHEERIKIWTKADDFHLRLQDLETIKDKLKQLKRDKQHMDMIQCTKVPTISPTSREMTLFKPTPLEEMGIYSRDEERYKWKMDKMKKDKEAKDKQAAKMKVSSEQQKKTDSTLDILKQHKIKKLVKNKVMGTLIGTALKQDGIMERLKENLTKARKKSIGAGLFLHANEVNEN